MKLDAETCATLIGSFKRSTTQVVMKLMSVRRPVREWGHAWNYELLLGILLLLFHHVPLHRQLARPSRRSPGETVRATQFVAILVAFMGIGQAASVLLLRLEAGDGSPFSSETGQTCRPRLRQRREPCAACSTGLCGADRRTGNSLRCAQPNLQLQHNASAWGSPDHAPVSAKKARPAARFLLVYLCANFPSVTIVIILLLYSGARHSNSF